MPKVESGITEVLNAVRETVQRRGAGRLSEASGDAPKTLGQGGNLNDWAFLDSAAVKSGETFEGLVDSWKELFGESVEAAREWVVGAGCWSPVAAKALQKAGVTPKQAATLAPPGVGTGSYTDRVGYKVSCGDLKVEEAQEFLSTVGGAERNLAGLPKERAASVPTKDAAILEVFADTSTDAFDVLGRLRQALQPLPAVSLSRPDFDGKTYVLRVTGPAAVAEKARKIVHEALAVSTSAVAEYTVYVRSDSGSDEELMAAKAAIEKFASEQEFNWDVRTFSGETFGTKSTVVVYGVIGNTGDADSAIEKVVGAMGYAGLSAAKESKFSFVASEAAESYRLSLKDYGISGHDAAEDVLARLTARGLRCHLGGSGESFYLHVELGQDFTRGEIDRMIRMAKESEGRAYNRKCASCGTDLGEDKDEPALCPACKKAGKKLGESATVYTTSVDVEVYADTVENAKAARDACLSMAKNGGVGRITTLRQEAGLASSFVVKGVQATSSSDAEGIVKRWLSRVESVSVRAAGKKLGEASSFTTSQSPRWVVSVDCSDSEHEDVKAVMSKEFGSDFVLSYRRGRNSRDSIINVIVSAETREDAKAKVDASLSKAGLTESKSRVNEDDTDGGYDGLGGPAGTVAGDEGGAEVSPPDEGDEFDDEFDDEAEDEDGDGTLKELKPGDTALLDIGEGAVEVTVSEGSDDKPYKKTINPWGDEESPEETVYLVEIVDEESGETVTSYVRAQLLR